MVQSPRDESVANFPTAKRRSRSKHRVSYTIGLGARVFMSGRGWQQI
jgi:hypothetical protein